MFPYINLIFCQFIDFRYAQHILEYIHKSTKIRYQHTVYNYINTHSTFLTIFNNIFVKLTTIQKIITSPLQEKDNQIIRGFNVLADECMLCLIFVPI